MLAVSVLAASLYIAGYAFAENSPCLEIKTVTEYKMDDVVGVVWYPTDIILHRDDIKIAGVPLDSYCPEVTFSQPVKSKRALTMIWNTTEGELKYSFTPTSKSNLKGQWQSSGEQQGPLAKTRNYKHFGGLMLLLELDRSHAFFMFCSKNNRILSTMALSRTRELPQQMWNTTLDPLTVEIASVLSVNCTKEAGDTGATSGLASSLLLVALSTVCQGGL